jgi:hypothetical protein
MRVVVTNGLVAANLRLIMKSLHVLFAVGLVVGLLILGSAEAVNGSDSRPASAVTPNESTAPTDLSSDIPIKTVAAEAKDDEREFEQRTKDFDGDEEEHFEEYEEDFGDERKQVDALLKLGMRIGAGEIDREEAWKEIRENFEEEEPEGFQELRYIVRLGVKISQGEMTEDEAWFLIFEEDDDDDDSIENLGRQIREAVAQGELTAIGSTELWQTLKSEAAKIERE